MTQRLAALLICTALAVTAIGCSTSGSSRLERATAVAREADRKWAREGGAARERATNAPTAGQWREFRTIGELIRLARGYNTVSASRDQIDVSDEVLARDPANAEALACKANGLRNLYFWDRERGEEIRFYDECIRYRRHPLHMWYLRKARALCQSAVDEVFAGTDGGRRELVEFLADRGRYEEAFQCLKNAFEIQPDLLQGKHDDLLTDDLIPLHFPLLNEEQRFRQLLEGARQGAMFSAQGAVADLRKADSMAAILFGSDTGQRAARQRLLSRHLEANGRYDDAAAAMSEVIREKQATPEDVLRFVQLVMTSWSYSEADEPEFEPHRLIQLLRAALNEGVKEPVPFYLALARLQGDDAAARKESLYSALKLASRPKDEAAALVALLQFAIGLSADEEIRMRKRLFQISMELHWPTPMDELSHVFYLLVKEKRYEEVVDLWNDALVVRARMEEGGETSGVTVGLRAYGQALFGLGEYDNARRQFERRTELMHKGDIWSRADNCYWLAKCQLSLGNRQEARELLKKALNYYKEVLDACRSDTPESIKEHRRADMETAERELMEVSKP